MGIASWAKRAFTPKPKIDKPMPWEKQPEIAPAPPPQAPSVNLPPGSAIGTGSGGGTLIADPTSPTGAREVPIQLPPGTVYKGGGGGGPSSQAPVTTGGMSTVGGQEVLVTSSGKIVGSASSSTAKPTSKPITAGESRAVNRALAGQQLTQVDILNLRKAAERSGYASYGGGRMVGERDINRFIGSQKATQIQETPSKIQQQTYRGDFSTQPYSTLQRGTRTDLAPKFEAGAIYTTPTVYKKNVGAVTDIETGEQYPYYSVEYIDPTKIGEAEVRAVTPEERAQFQDFEKGRRILATKQEATKLEEEGYTVLTAGKAPPAIVREYRDIKDITGKKMSELSQAQRELDFGGKGALDPIISDKVIQETSYILSFGIPPVRKYAESSLRYIKEKPFTILSVVATGFGLGAGLKSLGIIGTSTLSRLGLPLSTKIAGQAISKVGTGVGIGLMSYQGVNVVTQIDKLSQRQDLSTKQKVDASIDIVAKESIDTAAFMYGANIGGKAVSYVFEPRPSIIKYTEINLNKQERNVKNIIKPVEPTRLIYTSTKQAETIMQKFTEQGVKYQVKEGEQVVFMPRYKEYLSTFIPSYTPKPTYFGRTTKGTLTTTDIFGAEKAVEISSKDAMRGYNRIFAQLQASGMSKYQAKEYLRFRQPKIIKSELKAEAVIQQDVKGDTAIITGIQQDIPIRRRVSGLSDDDGWLTYSADVKTAGKKEAFDVRAVLEKEPRKKGIESIDKDVKSIYGGTKEVQKIPPTMRVNYKPKQYAEKYVITPKERLQLNIPDDESAIYYKIEKVNQQAYTQLIKDGKPGKTIYADTSKTFIRTKQPFKEVLVMKEFPQGKRFEPSINDYVQDVKITGEGLVTGEVKLYKLRPEMAEKAQPLPFMKNFEESYSLVAEKEANLLQLAPKKAATITQKFTEPKKVIYLNEKGKVEVFNLEKGTPIKKISPVDYSWLKAKREVVEKNKYATERAKSLTFEEEMTMQALQQQQFVEVPMVTPFIRTARLYERPTMSFSRFDIPKTITKAGNYALNANSQYINNFFSKETTDVKSVSNAKISPIIKEKIESRAEPNIMTKIETRLEPRIDIKIETKLEPSIRARVEPRLEPKIQTKLEPKLEPKVKIKLEPETRLQITTILQSPFRPIRPKLPTLGFVKQRRTAKPSTAYSIFLKRSGKYLPIAKGLPRGRALQFGSKQVLKELSRRFKIVPTGTTELQDIDFIPSENVFRQYSVKRGTKRQLSSNEFIQKTSANLQNQFEKMAIVRAKRAKQQRGTDNLINFM